MNVIGIAQICEQIYDSKYVDKSWARICCCKKHVSKKLSRQKQCFQSFCDFAFVSNGKISNKNPLVRKIRGHGHFIQMRCFGGDQRFGLPAFLVGERKRFQLPGLKIVSVIVEGLNMVKHIAEHNFCWFKVIFYFLSW